MVFGGISRNEIEMKKKVKSSSGMRIGYLTGYYLVLLHHLYFSIFFFWDKKGAPIPTQYFNNIFWKPYEIWFEGPP